MSSMSIARSCSLVSLVLVGFVGCGPSRTQEPVPDAAPPSIIPSDPAGVYAVTSTFDLRLPAVAEPVMITLTAATDGPDDPSRYVIDKMIECMPDGSVKTIALTAAPYVAAYINARLNEIAPRFAPGLRGIATGLSRIATHFGTLEALQIAENGTGIRTITGIRFEVGGAATVVRLADAGLPDFSAGLRAVLDATGQLAISEHTHGIRYGAILRLGLERAVVPSVEPTAHDLASALGALLDCDRLGAVVADRIGLGSAALYAAGCRAAMTALASEIDAQLAAIDQVDIGIEVAGTAQGADRSGDGRMDEFTAGRWSGAMFAGDDREPINAASFAGAAVR